MTLADAVLRAGWSATPPSRDAPVSSIDLRSGGLDDPTTVVGVDVGGTKIHGAAWGRATHALTEARVATDPVGGLTSVAQITGLVAELTGGRRPAAVTLGAPGIPQRDGRLAHAPNLPGWDRFDVVTELGRQVGAPVRMENDVALAAWGEHLWGGERDIAFIAVGTGIGVGIVQDGQLLRGSTGGAGEVFDLPLVTPSAVAHAHTLEDVASGPGLQREYAARTGDVVTTREVLARTSSDPAADDAVTAVAAAVAHLVTSIRCLLDPRVVVLGGGLGSQPQLVRAVQRRLAQSTHRPVNVEASRLGPSAATVGALGLAATRAVDKGR